MLELALTLENPGSKNNTTKPAQSNGILKFINERNSSKRPEGKKCNPYRQFGISSDAPAQFCTKNTLIADMVKYRQAKVKHQQKPENYSQKNFFTIGHHSQPKCDKNFVQQYHKSHENNKQAFHHNSNKITQFFEKNAWMGSRFHVMGHQRTETARELSKINSQVNCRSAKSLYTSRKRLMTPATTKTINQYPTHQSMKQLFMIEKGKIRQMRNMLATNTFCKTQQKRPYTSYQNSRSTSRKFTVESSLFKKPKQFEINVPEWEEKDFNIKFLQWNPERKKELKNIGEQ